MGQRKRKTDIIRFPLEMFLRQKVISELCESVKMSRQELMACVRKWDFLELNESENTIAYKPKYPSVNCWDGLLKFLKDPQRRLQGLELEEGIELDTYWQIREEVKRRLSQPGCGVREIEIKGTDKRYLYFLGQRSEQPFTKVQFLSKCDKVVNSYRKSFEVLYSDRGEKKNQTDTKENEWVEGWLELREKYFKELEVKKK